MKCILCFLLSVVTFASGMKITAKANININFSSAIVVNANTGEVLYSHNSDKRLAMASTTKIMTAILLLENAKLNEEIVTTKQMVTVEGSSMGLLAGDKVTYETLLYGMMLSSGNDAATTVAISLGGSLEKFAFMMNKKAAELKMDNTHFVTPSGLDSELHYSTASDMAKLAVYAMKNKKFRQVVNTKSIRVKYGNPPYSRSLFGHNKLLDNYRWATGIKTGYTSKAGRCLVSSATRGNSSVIAVTLNDNNTVSSHISLLEYGLSKLQEYTFELPYKYTKIPIISGTRKYAKVTTRAKTIGISASERENLEYKITLKPFLYAPQTADTKVGKIVFTTKNGIIVEQDIVLSENVLQEKENKSFFDKYKENLISLLN